MKKRQANPNQIIFDFSSSALERCGAIFGRGCAFRPPLCSDWQHCDIRRRACSSKIESSKDVVRVFQRELTIRFSVVFVGPGVICSPCACYYTDSLRDIASIQPRTSLPCGIPKRSCFDHSALPRRVQCPPLRFPQRPLFCKW